MSIKIRFTKDISLVAHVNICCFSGDFTAHTYNFQTGDVAEVLSVNTVKKVKAKGGAYNLCTIYCLGNRDTLHPDRFYDVPSNVFEVIGDTQNPEKEEVQND
jgi:hypothetical protein